MAGRAEAREPDSGGTGPDALDGYLGFLLRRMSTVTIRSAKATMPPGMTPRDVAVLRGLAGRAAYSQLELARRFGLENTVIIATVDGLESAGWVERTRNPYDRRSYSVTITPAGREAIGTLVPLVSQGDDDLTARLRAPERRKLDELLAQLLADLEPGLPPTMTHRTSLLIAKLHEFLRRWGDEELAPLGIQVRHFWALQALLENQPCKVRRLADAVGRAEAAVTATLNELQSDGLIERYRDPADRRQKVLRTTAAGAETREAARQIVDKIEARTAAALGERGRRDLVRLLRALLD
jgi:DNA-binding MarR family transcriptional regulator